MKQLLVVCVLLFAACGCESMAGNIGLGVGAGSMLSSTIAGAKADLEAKEAALIELYNQGVADGKTVEELAGLKQAIYDTQLGKKAVETGEQFLGVDWQDPKETGGVFGGIAALAYAWWKRKELAQTVNKYAAHKKVVNNLMIEGTPEDAQKIYDDIGKARNGA